jgi:peptidoglycan/LPS O-acetylase OafA/YrhL
MFAYLVAGLIVGGLMRYLRHESGDPPVWIQLVVGLVAAGIGGLVINVLLGEDFMAITAWGFAAAAIAAAVALAFVQNRGRRSESDATVDG